MSWNLAQAVIHTRQSSDPLKDLRPMHGSRGLVRLLLFYGANVDYVVRLAVLDEGQPAANRNRYFGFAGDMMDAKCWRRGITDGRIGGLPEETARMIMLMNWENWCA